jgi:predicted permease
MNRLGLMWRALLRKKEVENELDEELRYHLDQMVEHNLAAGMTAEQARTAARRSFGGIEQAKEECREAWGGQVIEALARDLRHGARELRRSPGFTLTAVLSLALGIGSTAAIFSLLNAVMLRSLPVQDPDQLVLFFEGDFQGRFSGRPQPGPLPAYSYPLYQRLAADREVFAGVAAEKNNDSTASVRWAGSGSDRAVAKMVTSNYFDVLGVPAFRGRTFVPRDEAEPVVLLSHAYWQRRFGGSPAAVGSAVTVNGALYTVVGVMPPAFTGAKIGVAADVWIPITMLARFTHAASLLEAPNTWWLKVYGRLHPGGSLAAASARANVILAQFLAEHPGGAPAAGNAVRIALTPGGQGVDGLQRTFRQPLLVLMVGVSLLLLIACLNVSHLLLARATRRQHEMSLRLALGASRGRLVQQLLTEAFLLSALGTAAGLALMTALSRGLIALVASQGSPLALDVTPDLRVLGFAAALALVVTILLGVAPAWNASRAALQPALRGTARAVVGSGGGVRPLSGRLPLISQVACSLVLLVTASLLGRSLGNLREVKKGFDEEHVLLVQLMNPRMSGLSVAQAMSLHDDLLARITALPGVRAASLSEFGMLSGNGSSDGLRVSGLSLPVGGDDEVRLELVTPEYFHTVGMTLLRGRGFTRADHKDASPVAVVNQTLATRFFGGADAIGRRVRRGGLDRDIEVIGIVADAKVDGLRGPVAPRLYQTVAQNPGFLQGLEVRTAGDPGLLAERIRRTVGEAHPDLLVTAINPVRGQLDRSLWQERLVAALATAFGVVALFLVCVGLYGVMSQAVGQRTNEIGLEMALGATAASVRWKVLREALVVVLMGLAVGLPTALGASRLLTDLLYGLGPTDPLTLAVSTLVMLAVALLATYLPARRASLIDPMTALRCE